MQHYLMMAAVFLLLAAFDGVSLTLPPPLPTSVQQRIVMPFQHGTVIRITEGWLYSDAENDIHGVRDHGAVDIATKEGTPVYAAISGEAFGGLQLAHRRPTIGKMKGHIIGYGGGYFVEIRARDGLRVQVCHLKRLAPGIRFSQPVRDPDGETWNPFATGPNGNGYVLPPTKPIKAGDLIGYVGHSGLSLDKIETPATAGKVRSWDEDHIHLWCGRRGGNGIKTITYDAFGLQSDHLETYNALLHNPGTKTMWKVDKSGHLVFAQ